MDALGTSTTVRPSVGLAYSSAVRNFVERHRAEVDHVEIPFELLRHNPTVLEWRDMPPTICIVQACRSPDRKGAVKIPSVKSTASLKKQERRG